MEDQECNRLTYGEFFNAKPAIVVFFYTRCNNSNKCSLTITKLGRLQKAIAEAGLEGQLKTAAITYDPEYDLPPRLKAYAENRGVVFSDEHRILRTTSGFHELQESFQLGVNFTAATVNRHTIELFILNSRGEIAATFSRLQWDIEEVLEQAKTLLDRAAGEDQSYPHLNESSLVAQTSRRSPVMT
jgi:protein SCO1/2